MTSRRRASALTEHPRRVRGPALIALLVAALLLVVPLATARAAGLERGDTGPRVERVQRLLGLQPDRIYGPATVRAVRRFQRRHGLTADGKAGPVTMRALRRAAAQRSGRRRDGTRVASRGGRVRLLQRELRIAADGIFGPGTARAVRRFQRRRGLAPDGAVGPATWAALGHPRIRVVLKRRGGRRGSVRRRSSLPIAVRRVIAAGNRIAHAPYRYGGGHRSFQDSGYDCSGSVSYALHGGGLLGRPRDSGEFTRWGAPGRGRWITIYASPGHVYMVVRGRRFDTTGRHTTGSRWQWTKRSTPGWSVRHPPGL